jgi:predicted dehydrogenase
MNIAVIGCGYWGSHILRNFNNSDSWNLVLACDLDKKQLDKAKHLYPQIATTTNPDDVFNNSEIDVVAIATPVFSHYELAKKSLIAGKHTWVEKPLTSTSKQAEELINIAKENGLILNVDHTYIYTSAVQKIKELISNGVLGDILYFDSVRINLGLFQHDVNVIWDLAPHDIAILEYCVGKKPISVNATGSCVLKYSNKNIENIAYLTINYHDGSIAHIHSNWLSPVKIRKIIFGGSEKMLVFDDMENAEKIKIYDTGVKIENKEDIYESLIQYRIGDMISPSISNKEALKEEVEHFYNSILNKSNTITDGEMGLRVVKILEAANLSLAENGKTISIV